MEKEIFKPFGEEKETIEQFGARVKRTYPQYNDLSDADLGAKVLKKYPVYQDMILTIEDETFGQRFKNTLTQERQKIQDIRGSNSSMGTKVAQQSAVVTGLPLKAVKQALPEFARQGLDKAGGKIGQGVNWL